MSRAAFQQLSWLAFFWPRWLAATPEQKAAIAARHDPPAITHLHRTGVIEQLMEYT